VGSVICTFVIWRDILEIQNLLLFSSYGSRPKMVEFTSVCVLCHGSTCTTHLQSNFAQIWCAFILRAYLEITEKKLSKKWTEMSILKMPWAFVSISIEFSMRYRADLASDVYLPAIYNTITARACSVPIKHAKAVWFKGQCPLAMLWMRWNGRWAEKRIFLC
jgi:hypothetical protein